MPRWLRVLILFLMVLSLVIYISPIQVQASAIGASIAGVTAVNVPAGLVFAAAAIALGVAAGTNDDFVNMVGNAVSSAGDWVINGTVELLQTVDTLGQKTYYVAGQLMADLHSWLYDTDVITAPDIVYPSDFIPDSSYDPSNITTFAQALAYASTFNIAWWIDYTTEQRVYFTNGAYVRKSSNNYVYSYNSDGSASVISSIIYRDGEIITNMNRLQIYCSSYPVDCHFIGTGVSSTTSLDLTLGYLPSSDTTLTDDTVVTFHPYLTKVIRTGGSGGSDNNGNPKWWVGLALAGTAAAAALKIQQEVYEDTQVEEIPDISYGQEFDFEYDTYIDTSEDTDNGVEKEYIIITPVETPGTGNTEGPEVTEPTTYPYPGTGTNPDTGDTTDPDPGDVTDPDAGDVTDPDSGGTDTGGDAGDGTGGNSGSWVPPQNHNQFALGDLTKFFPFCIPFDLYDFFTLLRADPVAPVLSWEIRDLSGQTYTLTVDLAEWDSVALLFRRLQLFLFICGLAAASRKYIKW